MTTSRELRALVAAGLNGETDRRKLLQLAGAAAVATGFATSLPSMVQSAAAQAEDNVFIFGSGQDMATLDLHTGYDASISWALRATYDSLLRFEGDPLAVVPLLASDVSGSEDGSVWTISIDPAATFQDGSAVTAEAVKWNFERLLAKNLGSAWMFTPIMTPESLAVVDDQTVEVTLTIPFAAFDLILPYVFIGNPTVIMENEVDGDMGEAWLVSNTAGGGPYTMSRYEPGSLYQFDRNPDYWFEVPTNPNPVDTFVWRIIRESSTKRIAMEAGEIQYGDVFTVEDVEALRADERFVVNDAGAYQTFAIKLNNQVGPTADINVRKALTALFDTTAALGAVDNRGELLVGPIPASMGEWVNPDLTAITFDMDAAAAYLAESEYPDGFDMEYVYVTGLAMEEAFGLILLEKAAELGINVTITPLVWPDMVARASSPETMPAAMAIYAAASYIDPDAVLWPQYHSSQAGSWAASSWYENPEFDALIEEGRTLVDQAERQAIYNQAQQILIDDAVDIWVYTEVANNVWVKELGTSDMAIAGGSDIRVVTYSPA
jgi:peptide/nickel transport system substrate-binding protein